MRVIITVSVTSSNANDLANPRKAKPFMGKLY